MAKYREKRTSESCVKIRSNILFFSIYQICSCRAVAVDEKAVVWYDLTVDFFPLTHPAHGMCVLLCDMCEHALGWYTSSIVVGSPASVTYEPGLSFSAMANNTAKSESEPNDKSVLILQKIY